MIANEVKNLDRDHPVGCHNDNPTASALYPNFPIPDIKPTGDDDAGTGDGPDARDIGKYQESVSAKKADAALFVY